MLFDISRDAAVLKDNTCKIDERLALVHQSVLDAHRTASLHVSAMMDILNSTPQAPLPGGPSIEQGIPYTGFLVDALKGNEHLAIRNVSSDCSASVVGGRRFESTDDVPSEYELQTSLQSLRTGPATLLELSQNFFPESYTNTSMISKVLLASSCEESTSLVSRTNQYRNLYFQSPRRWCHLDVSVEIQRSSIYWATTKVPKRRLLQKENANGGSRAAPFTVPGSLLGKLQQGLEKYGTIEENAHIRFTLRDGYSVKSGNLQPCQRIRPHASRAVSSEPATSTFEMVLAYLGDLGCPTIPEMEIEQVAPLQPPDHFVAHSLKKSNAPTSLQVQGFFIPSSFFTVFGRFQGW